MPYPVTETTPIDITRATAPGIAPSSKLWLEGATNQNDMYGTRFNLLASHGRTDDVAATNTLRPYRASDNIWHVPAYGMMFTIPDALPGTGNKRTASSGVTIADRGGLVCRSRGQNARVEFGVRVITLDGTGGLSAAGAWNVAIGKHAAGSITDITADDTGGEAGYLLYPSGAAPGDLIQLYVGFRVNGTYAATPGYLVAWEIFEPNLTNANP